MSVLARFYVQQVTRYAHSPSARAVTLQAVSRGPENKEWAAATPSGQVTMAIGNGPAGAWFEERLGKDVLLTFSAPDDDEQHASPYTP